MDIPRDPRRAAPFSRVTIYNSSQVQTHVIIDRFSQGHTLRPGERKHDVELPNDEIAYFQEQRRQIGSSPAPRRSSPCIQLSLKGWRRCFRLAGTMNNGPGRRIAHVARRSG